MSNIKVVSVENHSDKRWLRNKNHAFTAKDAACILGAEELPKAILNLPVGFTKVEEQYIPVAVLGLQQGQNLVVDAAGRWFSPYMPAAYRCYPFSVAEKDGQRYLCIDEDVGLSAIPDEGEAFFDSKGQVTQDVVGILNSLCAHLDSKNRTGALCGSLDDLNLIEPWPISYSISDQTKEVKGLFRINEKLLNELSAESFVSLRDSGALILAYCQLLSMVHINSLIILSQNRNSAPAANRELNLDGIADSGSISFDNF